MVDHKVSAVTPPDFTCALVLQFSTLLPCSSVMALGNHRCRVVSCCVKALCENTSYWINHRDRVTVVSLQRASPYQYYHTI